MAISGTVRKIELLYHRKKYFLGMQPLTQTLYMDIYGRYLQLSDRKYQYN